MSAIFRAGEYEAVYRRFLGVVIRVVTGQNPLVGLIERRTTRHHGGSRNIIEGKEVTYEGQTLQAQLRYDRTDVQEGNITKHLEELRSFGNQFVEEQAKMMLAHFDKATDAVGNSFDAGGRALDHDLLLNMMESIPWRFDAQGNPILDKVFLIGDPALEPKLRELLGTMEDHARFKEVKQRKYEEWLATVRTRRLRGVDVP